LYYSSRALLPVISIFWPLNTVEILCPEVNLSSLHKNQTTSIPKKVIAREIRSRAGELKTGLKSGFDPVEVPLSLHTA
jgi:hypothetical protein